MNTFSGNRVLAGCLLFIFVVMSGSGLHSAGYSLLAPTFGISMTLLGSLTMVLTVSGIVSGVLLTSLEKRFTLKGILYFDAAIFYAVAVSAAIAGNRLFTLLLFFFSIGTTLSLGAQVAMTEIVSNWFIQGRARKISLVLGSALLGQAVYQFIGGQIFSRMDLLSGWILLYMVNGTILLLCNRFLILAARPEDIGQSPLTDTSCNLRREKTAPALSSEKTGSIYRSPIFWLCLVGDWCLAGGVNYITMYATSFFDQNGISLRISTIILSCATISAAIFSFLNGRVMDTVGVRRYVLILLSGVILGNLSMLLYEYWPSAVLILLMVLSYGIGYSGAHCINIVSGLIFNPEDAANANSKISSIAMSGGLLLLPLSGYLVDHFGYFAVYLVVISFALLSLICFEMALMLARRQGKAVS